MPIDIMAISQSTGDGPQGLQLIKLDGSQVPMALFTTKGEPVRLHFVRDPELTGYVHCNDPPDAPARTCPLCLAGNQVVAKVLLPAVDITTGAVGVLPASKNMKSGALLPAIQKACSGKLPVVVLVSKVDNTTYAVTASKLPRKMAHVPRAIADFEARQKAGGVDVMCVYPRVDDATLRQLRSVATILALKDLGPDAADDD